MRLGLEVANSSHLHELWLVISDLEKNLRKLSITPSKALGQNFLTDSNISAWIVDQLRPSVKDTVIEVGPGLGALTEHLVGRVKKLYLVEVDGRLADYLRKKYVDRDDVEVIKADAVQLDLRRFFVDGPVKLIGNLPYSCGGEIIRNFLSHLHPTPICEAVLMLQKEVGNRISTGPGSKAYGKNSVRVQAGWKPRVVRELSPEYFHPAPTIDSAIVHFEKRGSGELPPFDARVFDRVVRQGFSQRRKQMKKLLEVGELSWGAVCDALGWDLSVRAEQVSVADWVALARMLDPHPLKDNPQRGDELFDVVDENNVVVRQEKRAVVHADGLRHRAMHLFAFNKRGDLFLQKRSVLKDSCPGLWDSSAAGHLDVGESYVDCAVRELDEELGVTAELEKVAEVSAMEKTGWEFVELFKCEHGGPFTFPCSEVEGGLFFSQELISQWVEARPEDFAPGFLECWGRIF
ncbi:MAG: 16S rRNA (adenine1518-N6/adenine1519-N6)-dimethyltransferase [Verrucomicrobiales bacterium]|jgi:16S rRNA (adenine1518-N6/adenine1519-N6)-dimethyltransferase